MAHDQRRTREAWVDPRTWRVETRFGRGAATGSVLRVGGERIEAAFAGGLDLPPVGRVGRLSLTAPSLDAPITCQAMVTDRVDVARDLIVVGFELRPGPDGERIDPFAERRAVRIPISDDLPLSVTLRAGAAAVTGRVRDVSVTGLRVEVPVNAEQLMNAAVTVEVTFEHSPTLGGQPVVARIQHRRFGGGGVVSYGLAFAPNEVHRMERFVAELQRDRAREDQRARARQGG